MQAASKFQVIDQHGRVVSLTDAGVPIFHTSKNLTASATFKTEREASKVIVATRKHYPELSLTVKALDGDKLKSDNIASAEDPKAVASGSQDDLRSTRPVKGSSVYEEPTDKPAEQDDETVTTPSTGGMTDDAQQAD